MIKTSPLKLTACLLLMLPSYVSADDETDRQEEVRRTTAVALNYCRAALHRIRRYPEKPVLLEEQQRILNNLDLNRIEDPEVIALYKSVLDEISTVEISDRERIVIEEQFRRTVHRQLGTNFFVVGAQVATGQLGSAIQSGANSWWDYRNQEVRRDSEQWQVERHEFTSLMSRSGTFLDSFWRLSQKNSIPDRWLVRDQDLDQLGRVLSEPEAAQRLRMLTRMERFMECYPPYWYYLARTQQHLGLTEDALKTYERLTLIGRGHFRQDDMLASCLANTALLQEMQGHPDAPKSAKNVLDYSIRNWESNLIAAWVLARHRHFGEAEELIFCNLDENQEAGQSRVALISLYYHSEDKQKLAALLKDPQVLRDVPIPGLLLSARLLGGDVPQQTQQYLASTLSASVRRNGRRDSVSLTAAAAWKLQDSQPRIATASQEFQTLGFRPGPQGVSVDFVTETAANAEVADDPGVIHMTLNYPATPTIRITMDVERSARPVERPPASAGSFLSSAVQHRPAMFQPREVRYRISQIELDGVRMSFLVDPLNDVRRPLDPEKEVSVEEDPAIRS